MEFPYWLPLVWTPLKAELSVMDFFFHVAELSTSSLSPVIRRPVYSGYGLTSMLYKDNITSGFLYSKFLAMNPSMSLTFLEEDL